MQCVYREHMQNHLPSINLPPPPPPFLQPLSYQAFMPPPPQPLNFPQMGAHVDYNACLLEGFNQTYSRQRNQRCSCSSAAHSESGPVSLQNPQIYQHAINFQHEAEKQRYLQAQQD